MDHTNYWLDLVSKVGALIFAAALVAGLLSREFGPLHGILMATGLGMMVVWYWRQHRQRTSGDN